MTTRRLGDYLPLEGFKPEDVPMLLLPYQQAWLADESNYKNATKSRRVGMTWADAAGAALLAAEMRGRNTYYMGYEKEMARGYIQDVADWARLYNLVASEIEELEEVFRAGDEDKAIQVFRVWFNSGHCVEALSSKPRNMRSRQGDLVLDEAAFHEDLKGVLKAAKAMRIWGARIRLITTYNGVDNDYYELDCAILAGKLPYSRHFLTFPQAVEQGLYERICLVQGKPYHKDDEAAFIAEVLAEFGEDADEELLCVPNRSSGNYFSRVLLERAMAPAPVLRLSLPDDFVTRSQREREREVQCWLIEQVEPALAQLDPGLRTVYGMDFGRSNDLSYLVTFQIEQNLRRRSPFAIELRNVPFEQQRQVLFWVVDAFPRFGGGAMDARGNGQYLSEVAVQRYFGMVQAIMFTNDFYANHFPRYRAGMQDGKVLLPQDADILDDHRQVVLDRGIPKVPEGKKNKGTDGKQRHGDSAIAGLLAWYASECEPVPIEFRSTGQKSFAGQDAGVDWTGFSLGGGWHGF